jgi:hypothetical protein
MVVSMGYGEAIVLEPASESSDGRDGTEGPSPWRDVAVFTMPSRLSSNRLKLFFGMGEDENLVHEKLQAEG